MKQKAITLLLVVLIAGLMSFVVISSNKKEESLEESKMVELREGDPIYYYGSTCPYCKVVQDWLDVNKVSEKMNYTKKEVWSNAVNASELNRVAASCGLDTSSIGVPFLYAEGQCLIGAPDIIAYFESKVEIEQPLEIEGLDQAVEETSNETAN